jgi:hypothetical protein
MRASWALSKHRLGAHVAKGSSSEKSDSASVQNKTFGVPIGSLSQRESLHADGRSNL